MPQHVLALLVYPGLVLVLAFGCVAEMGAAAVLNGNDLRAALAAPEAWLRRALRRPVDVAPALLAMLAATQLAAPFSPVPPVERSLLVAAIAAGAAMWLAGPAEWTAGDARRTLLAQVCWFLALLTPALVSQTLRPQALAAVVVPSALPLKVAAGLLAFLCLPALLRLAPAAPRTPEDGVATRLPLWLPLCGLMVSLYLPPAGDDAGGLLYFLAAILATAAAAIGLAFVARRTAIYPRLLAGLALAVLVIAAVTSALT